MKSIKSTLPAISRWREGYGFTECLHPRRPLRHLGDMVQLMIIIQLGFKDGMSEIGTLRRIDGKATYQLFELARVLSGSVDASHWLANVAHSGLRKVSDFSEVDPEDYEKNSWGSDSGFDEYCIFRRKATIAVFTLLAEYLKNSVATGKETKEVTIICLGCAKGLELSDGESILSKHFERIHLYGIEKSRKSVEVARERYPRYQFIEGDVLDVYRHITELSDDDDHEVYVIAISLLNAGGMSGTYPAHRVLQQLSRLQKVGAVVIAGYGAPLFNEESADKAGWQLFKQEFPTIEGNRAGSMSGSIYEKGRDTVYFMKPVFWLDQMKRIIERSKARNSNPKIRFTTLDLSMTSYPDVFLNSLIADPECSDIKAVDISRTEMEPEAVENFLQMLVFFGIKNVIYSGFEPWHVDEVVIEPRQ